ncbi:MAG: biotin transporter BioY [Methanospirillum sp.]|uniref:biotin transporter BioY n=1 Tax=Methanospirillum sp. TaxID=45200 RepID=UPI002369EE41|nr:biotin transporter BioY [Methanospirillum sp.]MDD1729240.1 biotin transporter BioY [Methanospirillum sp.]
MFGNLNRATILTNSSLFIALIAGFSWISIPIPIPLFPVPVTLQTLAVLLAAAVMKRHAIIPILLYLLLGTLGLPIFHNGMSGLGVIFGPTGGYLFGFIPAVLVAGIAYEHKKRGIRIAGLTLATLLIYLGGISWLIISTGMSAYAAVISGMVPFLPGDLVKGVAVFLIASRLEHILELPFRQ